MNVDAEKVSVDSVYHPEKQTMKWLAALFLVFCSTMTHADDGKPFAPGNQKWKEDCGSCHVAYAPQLLAADDWQKLMGELDKHFGANAVLDVKENKEILDFLQHNAGTGERFSASSLLISDTPWFKLEHREISGNTWRDPAVKSPSNCVVCHYNAERGDWSKHGIRVPGG